MSETTLRSHINEFCWRHRNGRDGPEVFANIIRDIAARYRVNRFTSIKAISKWCSILKFTPIHSGDCLGSGTQLKYLGIPAWLGEIDRMDKTSHVTSKKNMNESTSLWLKMSMSTSSQ